jgi:hypothetical protein
VPGRQPRVRHVGPVELSRLPQDNSLHSQAPPGPISENRILSSRGNTVSAKRRRGQPLAAPFQAIRSAYGQTLKPPGSGIEAARRGVRGSGAAIANRRSGR